MNIRTRIFIAFLIIISSGFYFLVRWIVDEVKPRYRESAEETLVETARVLAALAATEVDNGKLHVDNFRSGFREISRQVFSARIYEFLKTKVDLRVYITDNRGIVVFDSDSGRDEGKDYSRWNDVLLTLQGQYGARTTKTDPDDPISSVLHIAAPILVDDQIVGSLTVAKPTRTANFFIEAAKKRTIVAGVVAFIAVILFGIFLSLWITRPLQALTQYARAVRDGKRAILPRLGRSEIGELGTAFDEMRDALEGKKYVEHYVETLTHEIKSPLSAIHGAAELLDESMPEERRVQFIGTIRKETSRIQKIIDRLLQLSSLESKKELDEPTGINLSSLLEEVIAAVKPQVTQRKICLALELHDHSTIFGDRFLVYHAITNVLQNAIEFTPISGTIEVTLAKELQYSVIAITDNGPGLPDYALERAFERFYSLPRPDTGEKSSGLGLSFVREVAELHGGDITIANCAKGGAAVTLRFPFHSAT